MEHPRSAESGRSMVQVVLIWVSAMIVKSLAFWSYRSTDFEVHRNWLAITSSLPISKWYFEDTSEWTLDYPPLFGWFEKFLSLFAVHADAKMLDIKSLNYDSDRTIFFQRSTVLLTEILLLLAVLHYVGSFPYTSRFASSRNAFALDANQASLSIVILAAVNAGLFITDHVHFQYNGMLLGLLLLSISCISNGQDLLGSFLFAVLVNMKHLYLSLAPAYFVYLLRHHCISPHPRCWRTGSNVSSVMMRFATLGVVVLSVFGVSLVPFYVAGGLPCLKQIFQRLFPFGRGLCHAYWAPNVWVAYNLVDKALLKVLGTRGNNVVSQGSMTGGLVGDQLHVWLPTVTPGLTILLSLLAMAPALVMVWSASRGPRSRLEFIHLIAYCSLASFLFGYHVHEKAVLNATLPMLLLAPLSQKHAEAYLFLCNVGHTQLLPLLFRQEEWALRMLVCLLHLSLSGSLLPIGKATGSSLTRAVSFLYQVGLYVLPEVLEILQPLILPHLPFLPLLFRSTYCLPGILISSYSILMLLRDETRSSQRRCD